LASKTREAIFSTFGESRLSPIKSNASASEITRWKKGEEVKKCYNSLFEKISDKPGAPLMLTQIIRKVLKKDYSNVEMAYAIATCTTVLNPKYGKLLLSGKMMKRKIVHYLVIFCDIDLLRTICIILLY
jgi:hypothetical protein